MHPRSWLIVNSLEVNSKGIKVGGGNIGMDCIISVVSIALWFLYVDRAVRLVKFTGHAVCLVLSMEYTR